MTQKGGGEDKVLDNANLTDFQKGLVRELDHNFKLLGKIIETPNTAANFQAKFYFENIRELESLPNDAIAKIVILYNNLELFKGQKMSESDAKIQAQEIKKVIGMVMG